MIAPGEKRRLAVAAPLLHLMIGSALLALAWRPADLMVPMLVVAAVLPLLVGWWVFAGRPTLTRVLLTTWAPAGELLLLVVVVLAMRPSGVSQVLFFVVIGGPLLVLLVCGMGSLRGQERRTRVLAAVLWVVALAEVAVAIPLSERFGSIGDMRSLAGTVLMLLAPSAALGAWAGLALAARIPEPVRPREQQAQEIGPEAPGGGVT